MLQLLYPSDLLVSDEFNSSERFTPTWSRLLPFGYMIVCGDLVYVLML